MRRITFTKISYVTQKDGFPIPLIEESLYSLEGNQYFSTLDMINGYWIPFNQKIALNSIHYQVWCVLAC